MFERICSWLALLFYIMSINIIKIYSKRDFNKKLPITEKRTNSIKFFLQLFICLCWVVFILLYFTALTYIKTNKKTEDYLQSKVENLRDFKKNWTWKSQEIKNWFSKSPDIRVNEELSNKVIFKKKLQTQTFFANR